MSCVLCVDQQHQTWLQVAHESTQVRRFQQLGFQVTQNNQLTVEPCFQLIENSHFALNTLRGVGGNPVTHRMGIHVQRMSSRHAQRTPLPVARHARQPFLLLSRPHPASHSSGEERIEMPALLDSKGKQAVVHRTLEALAAGASVPAAPQSSSTASRSPPPEAADFEP